MYFLTTAFGSFLCIGAKYPNVFKESSSYFRSSVS